jgi:Fe2+ transport system protein FeoA
MINLSKCKENDTVRILQVGGSGILKKRLLEMRFMRGAELKIIKYAPLKDPMEVAIGDSHISLRLAEAALIDVEIVRGLAP